MTDESPWPWLGIGAVLALVGVVLTQSEDLRVAGLLALVLGLLLATIAVVALGVSMGMAHHARRRR